MKRTPFIVLLIIEIIASLISTGLLLSDYGVYSYLFGIVVFTLVLCPFFFCLKKEDNEVKKEKIRRNMLLVMLIPSIIAIVIVAYVVVALAIYFI